MNLESNLASNAVGMSCPFALVQANKAVNPLCVSLALNEKDVEQGGVQHFKEEKKK